MRFKTINGKHYVTHKGTVREFETIRKAWEFIFSTKKKGG